jgi:hypothetical protein
MWCEAPFLELSRANVKDDSANDLTVAGVLQQSSRNSGSMGDAYDQSKALSQGRGWSGAAGAVTLRGGFGPLLAQTRRQVSVGWAVVSRSIDIHCHCAIDVTEVVKGTPLANSGGAGGNQRLGPPRLQLMDQQGVDVQALTINGFWWYAATDREL